MDLESLLLVVGAAASVGLVVAAALVQRRDQSLRARLVVLFVTLALVPSFWTLIAVWRELAPGSALHRGQGLERSLDGALILARRQLAERQERSQSLAEAALVRWSAAAPGDSALLAGLTGEPYLAILYDAEARRVLEVHAVDPEAATRFLARPGLEWPQSPPPAQLVPGPDRDAVVVGVAGPVPGLATAASRVLVALPVPAAEAQAIESVVAGVRHAQGIQFLEELKLQTSARLMGVLALVYVLAAVLVGLVLARTLTRPIERLRRAFEAVASGDLGHQVEARPAGEGELGKLTDGFNRMSRELRESKLQLVRAARLAAWQDVARRLAHEIKNPLTPITLSIHRIRRRTASDDIVRECLDAILEETSHLERLADEFSSFARMPKPELRRMDPGEVLQQVLDLYSAHAGVSLRADLEGLPAVLADRDQVRQVFTNLVKNAVEAMPEGGALRVHWERDERHVSLTFTDTGTGFESEALEHLFDPTFTTKPHGSGLGLAIVRRIVEDHGGSIEAGNRSEGGAWVRVRLRAA